MSSGLSIEATKRGPAISWRVKSIREGGRRGGGKRMQGNRVSHAAGQSGLCALDPPSPGMLPSRKMNPARNGDDGNGVQSR